ncbi:hypothetical protein GIS00_25180 [Nakamurella sp. YIM 132087]|uniref:Uncharacterized protein n=1 Tax=Nakamurella alba TaxID=2665158 RepID=A0A7K1FSW8_9ACTN|nr:hypothetical protein [Nakamurella alba]MTD17228.1 hypothetical protein [Nakamurella alba]
MTEPPSSFTSLTEVMVPVFVLTVMAVRGEMLSAPDFGLVATVGFAMGAGVEVVVEVVVEVEVELLDEEDVVEESVEVVTLVTDGRLGTLTEVVALGAVVVAAAGEVVPIAGAVIAGSAAPAEVHAVSANPVTTAAKAAVIPERSDRFMVVPVPPRRAPRRAVGDPGVRRGARSVHVRT